MIKLYMTSIPQVQHLVNYAELFPQLFDLKQPWYEIHLHQNQTYDSFCHGLRSKKRKPLTDNALAELITLVATGRFSMNVEKAAYVMPGWPNLKPPTITICADAEK